jgi:hypothetical protein
MRQKSAEACVVVHDGVRARFPTRAPPTCAVATRVLVMEALSATNHLENIAFNYPRSCMILYAAGRIQKD